jgi:hypothetical protein
MKLIPIMIFLLSVLSSVAFASNVDMLVVNIDSDTSPRSFYSVAVLQYNDYPDARLFEEDGSILSTTVKLVVVDSNGKSLVERYFQGFSAKVPFDKSFAKVKVFSSDSLVAEHELNFCNNNNVCEPCTGNLCRIMENHITCSDCSSGSADGFCDTVADGICDPDCDFDTADPDCISLCYENCSAEEYSTVPSCAAFGGQVCEASDSCLGGDMYYTSDTYYCCIDNDKGIGAVPASYDNKSARCCG